MGHKRNIRKSYQILPVVTGPPPPTGVTLYQPNEIIYDGMFRTPRTDSVGNQNGYAGYSLAYSPERNSLIVQGSPATATKYIQEISIGIPHIPQGTEKTNRTYANFPTALPLGARVDVSNGFNWAPIFGAGAGKDLVGMVVVPRSVVGLANIAESTEIIVGSMYRYYNAAANVDYPSIFMADLPHVTNRQFYGPWGLSSTHHTAAVGPIGYVPNVDPRFAGKHFFAGGASYGASIGGYHPCPVVGFNITDPTLPAGSVLPSIELAMHKSADRHPPLNPDEIGWWGTYGGLNVDSTEGNAGKSNQPAPGSTTKDWWFGKLYVYSSGGSNPGEAVIAYGTHGLGEDYIHYSGPTTGTPPNRVIEAFNGATLTHFTFTDDQFGFVWTNGYTGWWVSPLSFYLVMFDPNSFLRVAQGLDLPTVPVNYANIRSPLSLRNGFQQYDKAGTLNDFWGTGSRINGYGIIPDTIYGAAFKPATRDIFVLEGSVENVAGVFYNVVHKYHLAR